MWGGGGGDAGHLPGASGSLSGALPIWKGEPRCSVQRQKDKEREGENVSVPCSPLQNPKP